MAFLIFTDLQVSDSLQLDTYIPGKSRAGKKTFKMAEAEQVGDGNF